MLVAQERLGVTDTGYGLLLVAAALGGVAGGWGAEPLTRRLGRGPAIFVSNLLPAIGHAGIALTTDAAVAALMLALSSFAGMVGNVVVASLRQTAIPNEMLGRVTSVYRLFGLGALPLGAACLTVMALVLLPILTTDAIRLARGG